MTQPRQARQRKGSDGPRMYAWPPQPPHEFEVISVTSAIGGGYPKPFLIGWAAKVAAEWAVDNIESVNTLLAAKQERAAIDAIKGARFRDADEKADRGTIVHAALEAYLGGKPLDRDDVYGQLEAKRVPATMFKSTFGMIEGVLDYFHVAEPEVLWSEATVYSREHRYAGTLDVLGRVWIGASHVPVVIDVKTSKRVYDETAMQLAAYARADFVGLDDGTEQPLVPTGERPEYGVVVRPMASGKFEAVTFALTDDVFELYLAVLKVASLYSVPSTVRRPS